MHPRRSTLSLVALAVITVVATACTGASGGSASPGASVAGPAPSQGKAPFIPQIISSESVVGPNRFLFGLLDASGTKTIAAPDVKVDVAFIPTAALAPAPSASAAPGAALPSPIPARPASFIWAIENERGVYDVDVTFPSAGVWTAAFTTSLGGAPAATVGVTFDVQTTGVAIPIGGKAPSTPTPTATTPADIARIASDPHPDPSFYTTSVDQALAKHEPFVLVFATPAFCTSKQCGPTLDGIKAVAKDESGMVFINVEPYKLQYTDGHLQPVVDANNQLQPTDTVRAWGLLSEPWVYVVDRDGVVRASFEAVVSPEELKAAIAAVR